MGHTVCLSVAIVLYASIYMQQTSSTDELLICIIFEALKNKFGAVGGTDAPAITLIPIAQMVLKYLSANSILFTVAKILLMNG